MRNCVLYMAWAFLVGTALGTAPNIILIMADDVSAKDFSLYGSKEIQTPSLEKMAAEGVYFQTAWSTPICSPSRAMIMTGKYANKTKAYHNNIKLSWNLARDHLTIGEMMKQAGYKTAFAGKVQMEGNFRADYGFDEAFEWADWDGFDGPVERWDKGKLPKGGWYDRSARYWHPSLTINGAGLKTKTNDYGPDVLVGHINRFIEANKSEPFFIYYPMLLPHKSWDFERNKGGYLPTPALDGKGRRIDEKSEPTLKANVEYMDYLVGEIRKQVERSDIADNTIIIYTSDNGTAGYGKGIFTKERGTRVPFVVWGPGHVKPIGASPELIDFSDVLPTLAEWAGYTIDPEEGVDGVSFAPILQGDTSTAREWIGAYFGPFRQMRTKEWLLDGQDRLFDCRAGRDDASLKNVSGSNDPDVMAAKEKLQALRALHLPLDDFRENAEIIELWKAYQKNGGPFIKSFVP
ncbi:Choline-sulfatase [Pontiella desulfatans]|uniref:Choline-sulfatase n=1 Tax=Pontiella desulfatans TaxID=2750659 RepID=A0A6C2U6H6_PONDE|nr:sulfatase-like hydrolase/transferase [Pontiella desulfatans]SPS73952.1 sulfatase S1_24 [Kiritimatiellales bacterium]VGO15131.1 Choline-sulfatase [Pontiella desulfatans]